MSKRSVILGLCALVFCTCLTGCNITDNKISERTITEYVKENQSTLESLSKDDIPDNYDQYDEQQEFIQKNLGRKTIVRDIFINDHGIIDFYCGGPGIIEKRANLGFYYSPNDIPSLLGLSSSETQLEETEPDTYQWEQNIVGLQYKKIVTKRITKNWFYYIITRGKKVTDRR